MRASVILCLRLYRAVGRQGSVVTGKSILSILSASLFVHIRLRHVVRVACRSVHTCIVELWRGHWAVSAGLSLCVSLLVSLRLSVSLHGGRLRRVYRPIPHRYSWSRVVQWRL